MDNCECINRLYSAFYVIECNTKVAIETPASTKFENKNKLADSRFAISNQSDVEQLKENSKNQNTLKETQTWLNVWQNWATERKVNQKIEE